MPLLEDGLFGLAILRPTRPFRSGRLRHVDPCPVLDTVLQCRRFLTISLLTSPTPAEEEQIDKFVDVFKTARGRPRNSSRISKAPTIIEFVELMAKFIGEKQAHAAISEYLGNREIDENGSLSEYELPQLKRFTEMTLAGSVGTAPARIIIENYLAARGSRMEDVFDVFGSVNISRAASREQFSVLYEAARVASSGAESADCTRRYPQDLHRPIPLRLCVIRILDPERQKLGRAQPKAACPLSHAFEADRELTMDTFIGDVFSHQSHDRRQRYRHHQQAENRRDHPPRRDSSPLPMRRLPSKGNRSACSRPSPARPKGFLPMNSLSFSAVWPDRSVLPGAMPSRPSD